MIDKIKNYLEESPDEIALVGPLAVETTVETTIDESIPTLYIDAGAKLKKDKGYSLGDNDSFDGKLDYILPAKKDFSDLSFALSLIPKKTKKLWLYGFLGGRKDHEFINFGECAKFLEQRTQSQIIFESHTSILSRGEWSLNIECEFSIVSFAKQRVSLKGKCEYPLNNDWLEPHSSHGLSNHGSGKVSLKTEKPLILFLN